MVRVASYVWLNAAPNLGVALDSDGDRRDARPDFGYDEFETHA